jgi:hypothetical protein
MSDKIKLSVDCINGICYAQENEKITLDGDNQWIYDFIDNWIDDSDYYVFEADNNLIEMLEKKFGKIN